ncbi:EAL domain-containing protein [Acidihalobacter ferrooxydans]|uniref:Diguanylate cyclase DosC n=1 Tax=Acidihalobacter ferrooxydans TaxID=1765967 RepID=A0A1P8UK89_9GAMM|nr:EAL domain-containing protein [Acidihalobacter ferrooxydans]APZ44251.1 hypothetical protein BW247_15100 [Acidihalobacter ferrooxydans]
MTTLSEQTPLRGDPENPTVSLCRFVGLDTAALALVREHAEILAAQADGLAGHFYDALRAYPPAANAFAAIPPRRMRLLVERQAEHFRAMLRNGPHTADDMARLHHSLGIAPTWIVAGYNACREHLDALLVGLPVAAHDALREALGRLLTCDMMVQTAALEDIHADMLAEGEIITQTLLDTTLKLADLPSPEAVFSDICADLVTRSRHLSAVWFAVLEDPQTPLKPFFGAGATALWQDVDVPYDASDPLWQALDENRSLVVSAAQETPLPAWWPSARDIEAVAIFPFGRVSGMRGLGVVYADHDGYFDHVGSAPFDAFAKLGQVLLDIRDSHLHDPLTGLPNRSLYMDRLVQGVGQAGRRQTLLGVSMIDLDGFKKINDRLGHLGGDALLHQVAERLSRQLRQGDTLARLGGDEFGLLMTDLTDVDAGEKIVRRMLNALEEPFLLEGKAVRVGASLGLTLYPLDDADSQDLLRHADIALYQAKDAGRHTYRIFEHAAEDKRRRIDSLQQRFEQALSHDEIEFHYQPKVDLALGRLVGVEALARWRQGDTLVSPEGFIDAVEDSPHLSRRLGRYALVAAARQIMDWKKKSFDCSVAVNIGAEHLLNPAFIDDVDDVLECYPTVAARLEIEVTERAVLHDMQRTHAALQACSDRGLSIALDDFGTGHASLTYLQELPADQIKLDKRFVQKLLDEPRALAIVAGSLTSASLLNLGVIAEGVETIEQGELLLQLGCRQAQGFFIAKPLSASDLLAWVAHWQPPAEWAQWRENLFTHQDLPFLMARTAHRHNLRDLLAALATPPTPERPFLQLPECVDETHCALGRWLRGAGQRYRAHAAFKQLQRVHVQLHAQAIKATLAWQTADAASLRREVGKLEHYADDLDGEILRLARQIGLHDTRNGTGVR